MSLGRIEKTAIIAIGVSTLLVVIKYLLARMSGSVALVADSWHSLSDVFVSVLVLVGVWISKKQWRLAAIIENVIALLISVLIFIATYFLVVKSLQPRADESIRNLFLVLIGTVFCAAISRLLGNYEVKVGKEEGSSSLTADGYHSVMDFYTTIVVAVALLGQMIGLKLDNIAAVLVAIFIIQVGFEIAVMAIKGLRKQHAFSHESREDFVARLLKSVGRIVQVPVKMIFGNEMALPLEKIADWFLHRKKWLALATVGLLAVSYLFSGIYTVKPHQTALVTVFGKALSDPALPGIHYAPPRPIGKVYRVDTSLVRRIEVGFRTREGIQAKPRKHGRAAYEWHSLHTSGIYEKKSNEAIMMTGDENIIDMNAVVHFTVSDPHTFTFGFADQIIMLRAFTEDALRSIVSVMPIEDVLTGSRNEMQENMEKALQSEMNRLRTGIRVVAIQLQDVHPPIEVVRAFRDVASAKEEKALSINEAYADYNEKIPNAHARAESAVFEAEGYRDSKIFTALGDAARFGSLVSEYKKAREVTAFRLYVKGLEESLEGKKKFIVSPSINPGALDLRIFTKKRAKASSGKK